MYRLRPEDFGELTHVDGISPAWPIGYEDMEPFYSKAEQLYQVHGNHGEDPTEGPWSEQYPWPPVSHEPRIQQLADDLTSAGFTPFHAPCGILLNEADRPRSTCIRCTWCDGYPCLVHAKSDAEVISVRPAIQHPNVTLLTGAEAVKLETDPTGRTVTGVVVEHDGRLDVIEADIVSVSTGAANSAKLLLRSATSRWSANRTEAMKGEEPKLTKLAPHWSLQDVARHAVDFWLTTEDLPMPGNRVTVDGDGNVHLAYRSTNDEEASRLYHEMKQILNHVGLPQHHVLDKNFYMDMSISLAGVAHQAGSCRFGRDPATSVLDTNCKAHELDNL
ncbi:MAG: GMC oxidoreductase [Actinomycetota bacterium]